ANIMVSKSRFNLLQ
ncbi:hypothetical protein D021_2107B, partial [Vibrio parahaemolyticus 10296]